MPPARSSEGWEHHTCKGCRNSLSPQILQDFFLVNSGLTHTGKAAQGGICRSCTAKDSECLTSSYQILGDVMLQVQKDSSRLLFFYYYLLLLFSPHMLAFIWAGKNKQCPGTVLPPWGSSSSLSLLLEGSGWNSAPPQLLLILLLYQPRTSLRALGDI